MRCQGRQELARLDAISVRERARLREEQAAAARAAGWALHDSQQYPGRQFWRHADTGQTQWTMPSIDSQTKADGNAAAPAVSEPEPAPRADGDF
jgi:hypothetical protein